MLHSAIKTAIRERYRILYIQTAFIGTRQNAVIEPKTATSSLTYWIDIQSVMVKKKGHLPMKMSPCAGEGNRKYVTPVFEKITKYSTFKQLYILLINDLALHISLVIIVNQ